MKPLSEGKERETSGPVPSVDRMLTMLELLANRGQGLSLSEISRELSLPKSSVHSILRTLERRKYLRHNTRTGKFLFDLKLLSLSYSALDALDIRCRARTPLRLLARAAGLTIHMAIRERNEMVLIEKLESSAGSRVATWIGRRMEMHCSALGKIVMAHLPPEELERLIREGGLPRHNDNTISVPRRLKLELQKARELGYAVEDEEDEVGFRCVAAPVFDGPDRVVAAISIVGTVEQITSENLPRLAELVKKTAAEISRAVSSEPEIEA